MPVLNHEMLRNILFEKRVQLRRIREQIIALEDETPFINYREPYYVNSKRNMPNAKFRCITEINELVNQIEHYEMEIFEQGILYR
jgi:hypothetical protein